MVKLFRDFIKEELKPVAHTQYGSNPGGIHHDEKGNKYYVKHYHNPDQAKVEALTGKLYHHMGIHTVNPERHGEDGIKTKWNDHLSTKHPNFYNDVSPKHAMQLGKMYHAAVLTKNWDIVGLEHDNVVHNSKTDDLHAIDHGGAFHFRAQGAHKDYGPDIDEKHSLMNTDHAAGQVFSSVFRKHPNAQEAAKHELRMNIDDDHVHKLFKDSGLKNWKRLHKNFSERKRKLLHDDETK